MGAGVGSSCQLLHRISVAHDDEPGVRRVGVCLMRARLGHAVDLVPREQGVDEAHRTPAPSSLLSTVSRSSPNDISNTGMSKSLRLLSEAISTLEYMRSVVRVL